MPESSSGQRRLRIVTRLVGSDSPELDTTHLCAVCAEVTATTGAGLVVVLDDGLGRPVGSSGAVSSLLMELEHTLGQGPAHDAHSLERPVSEPDLEHGGTPRWPAYAGPALAAGARAVFGFPLQVGAARLGALSLFRDRPGPLTDDQHADAVVATEIAAQTVLLLQAQAPPGRLAAELEQGDSSAYVVHQASGMVAAQLEVVIGVALVRLRAHAFAAGRPLTDVARDVVERRLRFEHDGVSSP